MLFEKPLTLNQLLGNITFAGFPLSEDVWDYLGCDKYWVATAAVFFS